MAREANNDDQDELTEHGLKSKHPMVTRADYDDAYGKPVAETEDSIVYMDTHGNELNEWLEALDIERDELSKEMHRLARETYEGSGDPWSVADPIVFDASTFEEEN